MGAMSHGENNGRGAPGMPVAVEAGPAEEPTTVLGPVEDRNLRQLPVLPLNDVVLFPSMVAPLVINTQRSMKLAEDISAGDRLFIAVLQREGDVPDDKVVPSQLHPTGCIARLIRMLRFPDDTLRILVQGQHRCRLGAFEDGAVPYLRAAFTTLKDETGDGIAMEALARNASQRFQDVITLSPTLPEELKVALFNIDDPAKLSDLIAANLPMPLGDRQGLLETISVRGRLETITVLLNREREVLKLGNEIQTRVSATFSKSQREYFLREQLKQIRTELGESDQQSGDQQALRKRVEEARMPEEARAVAEKELGRLSTIPSVSPEYGVIRTYLDWLVDLPWHRRTDDRLDLAAARRVLDDDHYGLAKIKDRILEFLAVLKLRKNLKGPILCFAGPPGVGKTSLGQSIAHALGRKFVRMSLGGVHDEAEIRGHRRTYIGALPGRIVQGLRRAGTRNPVFMLDEIDKVGQDFRGDPSSALLEVLDPEQNHAFQDHYLDVSFDLSQVLFITTANILDTIPPPLRDRMEVLEIAGYTLREKLHIARRHLVPKQIVEHGLRPSMLRFPDAAVEGIVTGYTREAGVRNLEREIASICRKAARNVAGGRARRIAVDAARLRAWLGPRRFEPESAERHAPPGVSTGLAWTPTGGDILFVEATAMPGKGRIVLTGLLGDVMKESAQAAVSFVRSRAGQFGMAADYMEKNDLHIHVPAGAIPKDGPSAGLAIVTALVSMLTKRPVPPDLAMTGEITLRGRVMPVGGIKEKVLAAARAGIRRLLVPTKNGDDLREVPADIRKTLAVRRVRDIDTALHWIFPGS
ncbi:MAG: endopeptidase La [Lentisphaerae bacterium]|nr:endopeptidase La [Lentisphaerota bacterium]